VSKPFSKPRFSTRSLAGFAGAGVMLVVVATAALIIAGSISGNSHAAKATLASSIAANSAGAPAGTAGLSKSAPTASPVTPATRARISATYAALPLAFEKNQGQVDPQVKYLARGNGYTLFLTSSDAVISLYSRAHQAQQPQGSDLNAGTTNRGSLKNSTASERHNVTEGREFTRAAKSLKISPRFSAGGEPSTSAQSPMHLSKKTANRPELSTSVVRMHLANTTSPARIAASDRLPGKINYYIGNDPGNWHTDVGQYARISYENVYPGVNLAFHGAQRQLEFDFIVAPGASSAPIGLSFTGASKLSTDNEGNLVLTSANGDLTLHRPVAYQENNGARQSVDARFVVKAKNEVTFALGPYDHSRELVIDPSVSYATYLGGNGEDEAVAIAVDSSGNAYMAGQTTSSNFPPGVSSHGAPNFLNAFVSKLNSTGTAIDFTTIIGGTNNNDSATGIAVNGAGIYVIGSANSTDFPALHNIGPGGGQDVFAAQLNSSTGAIGNYVTRIGGTAEDAGNAIAADSSGNAYLTGETASGNFPTAAPIQSTLKGTHNAFVGKLNSTGTLLTYSTYLGGSNNDLGTGVGLDGSNNAYVVGVTDSSDFPTTAGAFQTKQPGVENAFVAAINAAGSALNYATYLGGSNTDDGLGIAVDSAGEAYVTGFTSSANFPTANAAKSALKGGKDMFVSKLNSSGSALLFSTFYGGTLDDAGTGIALDSFNDAYVTGRTFSIDYPTSGSPFQSSLAGAADAFITEFSNTGLVEYSSYLGGSGNANSFGGNTGNSPLGAVAVDSSSSAYLAGATTNGFPVTSGVLQSTYGGDPADGFMAKVGPAPADFSVAISPTSISVTSGQTTSTITVTVSSVNSAFNAPVTLSCGNKPSNAACTFSTLTVTPTGTAATSNLTVSTNGSSGNGTLIPPSLFRSSGILYALLFPLFGVVFVGAGLKSRKSRIVGFVLVGLVTTGLLLLPACGGSSHNGGGGCSTVPGAPTGLAASGTTSTSTTLNWVAVTAPSGCSITSYTIYKNGNSIGTTSNTNFNVTGLTPSTQYSFTVAASDSAGISPQSSAINVTTSATGSNTPPGTYGITVTGTAGGTAHSATLTLTVH
jgi:hypothetical protein